MPAMARIARVVLPGRPHHVAQRGVRSLPVFLKPSDRDEYLRLLAEESARHGLDVLAYCLMTDHVHLVAVPATEESLARALGETHRRYTRFINLREGVRGFLFQGRFSSCPLDQRRLLAALRYVERNPVRAKRVRLPWRYPWSSAAYRVGERAEDPLVRARTPPGLTVNWRKALSSEPAETAVLRLHTRTGRPCGDLAFVRRAEVLTGRSLRPGKPGRPRKDERQKAKGKRQK